MLRFGGCRWGRDRWTGRRNACAWRALIPNPTSTTPSLQIFKEGGCGWGLRTLEDVKKGQLVFEYVGEVIDDDLLEVRGGADCLAVFAFDVPARDGIGKP